MAVLVKMATALVLACSAPYRHLSQAFPIPRNPDFTCSPSSLGLFSNERPAERGYDMEVIWPMHSWGPVSQVLWLVKMIGSGTCLPC